MYAPVFMCLCYKIIRIKESPEVELNADEIVRVHMRARHVICLRSSWAYKTYSELLAEVVFYFAWSKMLLLVFFRLPAIRTKIEIMHECLKVKYLCSMDMLITSTGHSLWASGCIKYLNTRLQFLKNLLIQDGWQK